MTRRPLTLGLAAASLAAAALALVPWLAQSARSERAAAGSGADGDAPTLRTLPPLAELAATRERPLFTPSRRPQPGVVPAGLGGGIETRYRLQGLIVAGTSRRAVVAETAGGRMLTLSEGEALDGWVVTRIGQDRVVLTSPAGEATLSLGPAAAPAKP